MGAQNARYLRSWHLYIGSILHVYITFAEKAAPSGGGKKPPHRGGFAFFVGNYLQQQQQPLSTFAMCAMRLRTLLE